MNISTSRKFIYLTIVLVSFFLLLEGFGQVLHYFKYDRWYRIISTEISEFSDPLFVSHSSIGYVLNPNHKNPKSGIYINSTGFRDDEIELNFRDEIKILLLGDSCAFGWHRNTYTDQNSIFPKLLENKLSNKLGRKVDVINAGVPGYSSYEVMKALKVHSEKIKPNYIIIYAGFNDIGLALTKGEDGDQNILRGPENPIVKIEKKFWSRINDFITFRSVFYSKLRNVLTGFGAGETKIYWTKENLEAALENKAILTNYENNIKEIIEIAQSLNTIVILVTLTMIYEEGITREEVLKRQKYFTPYKEYQTFYEISTKLNSILRRMKEEKNIFLIELDKEFKDKDKTQLFVDHVHFSPKGHKLVAGFLVNKLTPLLNSYVANNP